MIIYGKQIVLYVLDKHPHLIEEVFLSKEIDKIFSDHNYKNNLISLNNKYIQENI